MRIAVGNLFSAEIGGDRLRWVEVGCGRLLSNSGYLKPGNQNNLSQVETAWAV